MARSPVSPFMRRTPGFCWHAPLPLFSHRRSSLHTEHIRNQSILPLGPYSAQQFRAQQDHFATERLIGAYLMPVGRQFGRAQCAPSLANTRSCDTQSDEVKKQHPTARLPAANTGRVSITTPPPFRLPLRTSLFNCFTRRLGETSTPVVSTRKLRTTLSVPRRCAALSEPFILDGRAPPL